MKKVTSSLLAIILLFSASACRDMLETDSNRIVFDDKYRLDDPDNPFYAISGILSKLQQIGDRYVLLGELRGDLMQTTSLAPVSLQEINNFQVTANSEYADKSDYYAIINNCNYVLQRLDTNQVVRDEKVILRDYAEVKTIRAWTYFQLGQIFGEAVYFNVPIIDIESSSAKYPVIKLDDLVEILIDDLKPYSGLPAIDISRTPNPFISANLLLGDLYLYQNNYKEAAWRYYNEIVNSQLIISGNYLNRWNTVSFEGHSLSHWYSYLSEAIAQIQFSSDPKEFHSQLVRFSFNNEPFIVPVKEYIDFMNSSVYIYAENYNSAVTGFREGDLRGHGSTKSGRFGDAFYLLDSRSDFLLEKEMYVIYKFYNTSNLVGTGSDPANALLSEHDMLAYLTTIPIYRNPHLYLRFAEAVNRDGKPTLAAAVLKYGLNSANINDTRKVNPAEIGEYNFQSGNFDANIPMAARGRGYGIAIDTIAFVIPEFPGSANPRQDSILWVEDRILEELSAETSFEGNRFFDLLRVSRRRDNHPEFMANKVAAKYDNPDAMKARLMNLDNWFLP
ncbi:MAG: RagB/SusD family nutrient uptake outer membrane protein [Dysgonamonadaceae bacterium]|nr:RagB/SusD family nutrient uptake outer membrane protein [Dysgonamonadaceae bacterium]